MAQKKSEALTARQQRFVQEYLDDMNATQAAIRAGYSARSASQTAYDLLRDPRVKAAIAESQANLAEAIGVSAVMIAKEYKRIAFSDMGDLDTRCVAELSESTSAMGGSSKKVKLFDKTRALDSLAKMLGFVGSDGQSGNGKQEGQSSEGAGLLVVPPDSADWRDLADARQSREDA